MTETPPPAPAAPMSQTEERNQAKLAHILNGFFPLLGGLIFWLMGKDRSAYVNGAFPMRIFRAGSTRTSHNRDSRLSSRRRKTSILAPVFSFSPYKRAGKTLVLFMINTSPSLKYSSTSLKCLCSIV